jgi:uncharacterized protein
MKKRILLDYGGRNYLSFKEGFEISFRLGNNVPEDISKGKGYANILCIKGANASGKSNVIKGLNFLQNFCVDSFSWKPEDLIPVFSFYNSELPSEFFIVFSIDNIEYRYEVSLSPKRIHSEVLYKKINRLTKIFERRENKISYVSSDLIALKKIKLRTNSSIISTSHQYGINEIDFIYSFFNSIITNNQLASESHHLETLGNVSEYYKKNPHIFGFVKEILINSDLGISDIKIDQILLPSGEKRYEPLFFHIIDNAKHSLNFDKESTGTQVLYLQLFNYVACLITEGVLVLDEFDVYLHPDILPYLLNIFEDDSLNAGNSQLILTTHNSEIIDKLSKYRVYLTQKENNQSFIYRLDEIPGEMLRNDRMISKIYKRGKIGGVPLIKYDIKKFKKRKVS